MKTEIVKKATLPVFLPNGWKGEVARRIGVNRSSMCRILRNPKSPNYARVVKVATELYGK
jgi:hypothetical protein